MTAWCCASVTAVPTSSATLEVRQERRDSHAWEEVDRGGREHLSRRPQTPRWRWEREISLWTPLRWVTHISWQVQCMTLCASVTTYGHGDQVSLL